MFKLSDFQTYKQQNKKISMVTAYDYFSAKLVAESGIDTILVGDSLGMVFGGNTNTMSVTINDMIYHTNAVKKGAPNSFIIVDMPFLSYHSTEAKTIKNAGKIIKATNCNAVKLEINSVNTLYHVKALIDAQIPVIGHIGLTPQSVNVFGGFKTQGKTTNEANKIIDFANKLAETGVTAIVLECIPQELANIITSQISIPTIGIGAGDSCDGQVLVFYDLLGFNPNNKPKFVTEYANAYEYLTNALKNYKTDINQKSSSNLRLL